MFNLKSKSFSLALEVDLTLKLNLNNGQFIALVSFIDGYADQQFCSKKLMASSPSYVFDLIKKLRKKL